jgi:hypothetical protein
MLDVKSTSKGMLVPRMTSAQRDAISNPAKGLIVFCTDDNRYYFNRGVPVWPNWLMLSSPWMNIGSDIYFDAGNVGIGESYPDYPLNFPSTTGDKISLYGTTPNHYGFGIQGGQLQIHTDNGYSDITFGYGSSAAFTEKMRIKGTGAMGIGTSTPAASAILDLTSATKGFLPPRMNTAQISAIAAPADGLMVYNAENNELNIFVAFVNLWKEVGYGTGVIPFIPCGSPITINHISGDVAPVNKTVTYNTVTNIPGENSKCWITSNLGSDHEAAAVDDITEASSGWYWAFNRKQGYKHNGSTFTPAWNVPPIDEWKDWLPANDPCTIELGSDWRIPTLSEWGTICYVGGWTDWYGPWNSALKIHAAGYVWNGSLFSQGELGRYWSSTRYGSLEYDNGVYGFMLQFSNFFAVTQGYAKSMGLPLRCIRDY